MLLTKSKEELHTPSQRTRGGRGVNFAGDDTDDKRSPYNKSEDEENKEKQYYGREPIKLPPEIKDTLVYVNECVNLEQLCYLKKKEDDSNNLFPEEYEKLKPKDKIKLNMVSCKVCFKIGQKMYICHKCEDVLCWYCYKNQEGVCCKGYLLEECLKQTQTRFKLEELASIKTYKDFLAKVSIHPDSMLLELLSEKDYEYYALMIQDKPSQMGMKDFTQLFRETIFHSINNPSSPDFLGIYSMTKDCLKIHFKGWLEKVIENYHGIKLEDNGTQKGDDRKSFADTRRDLELGKTKMVDFEDLRYQTVNFKNSEKDKQVHTLYQTQGDVDLVQSTEISVCRNLEGYEFVPRMKEDDMKKIVKIIEEGLGRYQDIKRKTSNDTETTFITGNILDLTPQKSAKYGNLGKTPLDKMNGFFQKINEEHKNDDYKSFNPVNNHNTKNTGNWHEEVKKLNKKGVPVRQDEVNMHNLFPLNRFIYFSENGQSSFCLQVGCEDHVRMIVRNKKIDFFKDYQRLMYAYVRIFGSLSEDAQRNEIRVMKTEKHGYLSPNLDQLGTNLKITCRMNLEYIYKCMNKQSIFSNWPSDKVNEFLADIQMLYSVYIKFIGQEGPKKELFIYEVTNTKFLATTPHETVSNMYLAIGRLQGLEIKLKTKNNISLASKMPDQSKDVSRIESKKLWINNIYQKLQFKKDKAGCSVCHKEHDFWQICFDKGYHLKMYYSLVKGIQINKSADLTKDYINIEVQDLRDPKDVDPLIDNLFKRFAMLKSRYDRPDRTQMQIGRYVTSEKDQDKQMSTISTIKFTLKKPDAEKGIEYPQMLEPMSFRIDQYTDRFTQFMEKQVLKQAEDSDFSDQENDNEVEKNDMQLKKQSEQQTKLIKKFLNPLDKISLYCKAEHRMKKKQKLDLLEKDQPFCSECSRKDMTKQLFYFECPKCDQNLCLACASMELGYLMHEDIFVVAPDFFLKYFDQQEEGKWSCEGCYKEYDTSHPLWKTDFGVRPIRACIQCLLQKGRKEILSPMTLFYISNNKEPVPTLHMAQYEDKFPYQKNGAFVTFENYCYQDPDKKIYLKRCKEARKGKIMSFTQDTIKLPVKKFFKKQEYIEETRTFKGLIDWKPYQLVYESSEREEDEKKYMYEQYIITFSENFTTIQSGYIIRYNESIKKIPKKVIHSDDDSDEECEETQQQQIQFYKEQGNINKEDDYFLDAQIIDIISQGYNMATFQYSEYLDQVAQHRYTQWSNSEKVEVQDSVIKAIDDLKETYLDVKHLNKMKSIENQIKMQRTEQDEKDKRAAKGGSPTGKRKISTSKSKYMKDPKHKQKKEEVDVSKMNAEQKRKHVRKNKKKEQQKKELLEHGHGQTSSGNYDNRHVMGSGLGNFSANKRNVKFAGANETYPMSVAVDSGRNSVIGGLTELDQATMDKSLRVQFAAITHLIKENTNIEHKNMGEARDQRNEITKIVRGQEDTNGQIRQMVKDIKEMGEVSRRAEADFFKKSKLMQTNYETRVDELHKQLENQTKEMKTIRVKTKSQGKRKTTGAQHWDLNIDPKTPTPLHDLNIFSEGRKDSGGYSLRPMSQNNDTSAQSTINNYNGAQTQKNKLQERLFSAQNASSPQMEKLKRKRVPGKSIESDYKDDEEISFILQAQQSNP